MTAFVLFPAGRFWSFLFPRSPSLAGVRKTIKTGNIGFYVYERCFIQHIDTADNQPVAGPFLKPDDREPDPVGPGRMPARKYSVRLVIEECRPYQFYRDRPVEKIYEKDVRKKLNILKAFLEFRKNLCFTFRFRPEYPLDRASSFVMYGE